MPATSRRGRFAAVTAALILVIAAVAAVELPVEAVVTSDGDIPNPTVTAPAVAIDATAPGAVGQCQPPRCDVCGRRFAPLSRPSWRPLTDAGLAQGTVPLVPDAADGRAALPADGAPQGTGGAASAARPAEAVARTASPRAATGFDLATGAPAGLLGAVAGPQGMSPDAGRNSVCVCANHSAANGATGAVDAHPGEAMTTNRPGDTLGLWKTWRLYTGDGHNDLGALIDHARGVARPLEALAALSAVAGSLVRHRSGTEALRTFVQRAPMLRPRHLPRRCPVCAGLATLAGDAWPGL